MTTAILGVSMPHFWLGLILLFYFAVQLGWFPVAGSGFPNLVLPALTLGLTNAAIIARLTRSSMIDIFDQDFVRTAHAKGLPKAMVLYRHALRAGLVPIVTMMGLQFTYMMGGAIVVENVFGWNGVGRMAIQAIFQRDYPLIQGFILMFAIVVVLVSILMDVVYALLDPAHPALRSERDATESEDAPSTSPPPRARARRAGAVSGGAMLAMLGSHDGEPGARVGLVLVVVLIVAAIFAPWIAPYDPDQMGAGMAPDAALQRTTSFGTDEFGRDMFSRVIYGARLTIQVGVIAVGHLADRRHADSASSPGYARGWTERVLMRLVDVVFSFTETLIALAAVAVLGPSLTNAMIAVGIAAIPFYARVAYSVTLVERNKRLFRRGLCRRAQGICG